MDKQGDRQGADPETPGRYTGRPSLVLDKAVHLLGSAFGLVLVGISATGLFAFAAAAFLFGSLLWFWVLMIITASLWSLLT